MVINLFERILKYNPNDNQGVRYVLGDLFLRVGDLPKAQEYFTKNLEYPPYRYGYGLTLFEQRKYTEAITQLRRGFVENIYIAELLTGKFPVIRYDMWHGCNWSEPEVAEDYVAHNARVWAEHPMALEILQRLFTHPTVQNEIARISRLKAALNHAGASDQNSLDKRKRLLSEEARLTARINHNSSARISEKLHLKA